ncbi:MAG: NADH-quinone oxidoreductase subunit M, partial [Candidatus Aminicenantes bacterium]|nr:NADH-quinone oxidoreductase subunit M [Candidatus Aminicenantes bacterium]
MSIPILSLITFLPLAGALLLIFLPKENKTLLYGIALTLTAVVFLVSLSLYFGFDAQAEGPQFVEKTGWLGFGIQYHLGIDGISLFLVLLTTLLMPIALLSSWSYIQDRIKEYLIFMLILETGIIGVFISLNMFLFYVFWEATLIPMYFLIGIWGGKRRIYATMKFVMFTMLGSLLMLVAIFVLYNLYYKATGTYSLNIFDYYKMMLDPKLQTWLFLAFALAFAIKVPMFPFHTWLPDAHVEAPTAGSVLLAALLLKMGAYGFLRL